MPDISSFPAIPTVHTVDKHTDVSRFMCLTPHAVAGTGTLDAYGVKMAHSTGGYGYYAFYIPDDYVSPVGLYVYYMVAAAGQIVLSADVYYQKVGEADGTHTDFDTTNVIDVANTNLGVLETSGLLGSAEPGDFGNLYITRNGDSASDTLIDDMYIFGAVIEYLANQ